MLFLSVLLSVFSFYTVELRCFLHLLLKGFYLRECYNHSMVFQLVSLLNLVPFLLAWVQSKGRVHSWPLPSPNILSCILVQWPLLNQRWNPWSWWRGNKDTDPGPSVGLDLAPRAFNVHVTGYSNSHLLFMPFSRLWHAGRDNSAVSLELPISLAGLEIWQDVWYPSQSGVGYIRPGFGI